MSRQIEALAAGIIAAAEQARGLVAEMAKTDPEASQGLAVIDALLDAVRKELARGGERP